MWRYDEDYDDNGDDGDDGVQHQVSGCAHDDDDDGNDDDNGDDGVQRLVSGGDCGASAAATTALGE